MSLEDYVLSPRRVDGKLYAERLCDGVAVEIDVRDYDRVPVVYRGRPVWAHVDVSKYGIDARGLCEAVQCRESGGKR